MEPPSYVAFFPSSPIPTRFLAPVDCKKIQLWASICKRLRSPGIDAEESISPAYVACCAGKKNRDIVPASQVGNRFLVSFAGLQIINSGSGFTHNSQINLGGGGGGVVSGGLTISPSTGQGQCSAQRSVS